MSQFRWCEYNGHQFHGIGKIAKLCRCANQKFFILQFQGIWFRYSTTPYIFGGIVSCAYYNLTVINGTIYYEYHYQDPNRGNFELIQSGEILIDYANNTMYYVVTSPYLLVTEVDWIPINSTEAAAFGQCNDCGFYGTQDNQRNVSRFCSKIYSGISCSKIS